MLLLKFILILTLQLYTLTQVSIVGPSDLAQLMPQTGGSNYYP
jgi:hypothetical protein